MFLMVQKSGAPVEIGETLIATICPFSMSSWLYIGIVLPSTTWQWPVLMPRFTRRRMRFSMAENDWTPLPGSHQYTWYMTKSAAFQSPAFYLEGSWFFVVCGVDIFWIDKQWSRDISERFQDYNWWVLNDVCINFPSSAVTHFWVDACPFFFHGGFFIAKIQT